MIIHFQWKPLQLLAGMIAMFGGLQHLAEWWGVPWTIIGMIFIWTAFRRNRPPPSTYLKV